MRVCPVCGKRFAKRDSRIYRHAEKHVIIAELMGFKVTVNPIPLGAAGSVNSIAADGVTYFSTEMLNCPAVHAAWVKFRERVCRVVASILLASNAPFVPVNARDVASALGDKRLTDMVLIARPTTVSSAGVEYVLHRERGIGFCYRKLTGPPPPSQ